MPGIVTSCGRSWFTVASNRRFSGIVGLESASWITGMLEAEYLITKGGVMPGGSCLSSVCTAAVVCARPAWMFAVGWKNILITATPESEVESMCSMSLTMVVSARSVWPVMRWPISSGARPV